MLLGLGMGCGSQARKEVGGQSLQDQEAVRVTGRVIQPDTLRERFTVTGNLMANEAVTIRSEVNERIAQIHFREGQRVRKGERLVSFRDDELQARQERILSQLKIARRQERRQRKLLEMEGISQQEYEASLDRLKTLEADSQLVQAQLNKTVLRAPFSGRMGLRQVSPGAYLSQGDAIASLQAIRPIKLTFSVPERYLPFLQEGDSVAFTVAGREKPYSARIYAIEPQVNTASRTVDVRARAPNPAGELLPGGFAKVQLNLARSNDAIMIPTSAIIPELKGHKVYVVENGQARERAIKLGTRTEQAAQVTQGLQPNDTLVTAGYLLLKPGEPVRVKLESAPTRSSAP
jgi:membrane fusion protein (multidrug efflux system)